MGGTTAFNKIQIGKESVAGTPVAATTLLRFAGTRGEDAQTRVFPPEDTGLAVGTDRSYTAQLLTHIHMPSSEATFEQLPYILAAGIKNVVTGASDGVGTGKIYDYTFPTTAVNAIQTYTIETGNNQQAEETEYCFVESFTIEGALGAALKVSSEWTGRQSTLTTFTPALAVPTVEDILFHKAKLYIDPTASVFGTTLVSGSMLGMSLKVKTGWVPRFGANGMLYFSHCNWTQPEITLDVTFEHDANAEAERAAWRASTGRALQIKIEGSDLVTGGTLYQKKTFLLNLAGKWEKFSQIGDDNGNATYTGTFRARYNVEAGKLGNIVVVNSLTSLT